MADPKDMESAGALESGDRANAADETSPGYDGPYGLAPVLTVEEAAAFLRLNVKTVYSAVGAGQMPGRKVGNRTVILRDAMLNWLSSPKRVLPSRRKRRT